MSTVVDFHSHILPGIDDGSKTVEESVAMLALESTQGIDRVVATPHFYPQTDRLHSFLSDRATALERLREVLSERKELPVLHIGAEVHFFRGISDCEELELLTVDGGDYILIEMPHTLWTDDMYCQLERICTTRKLYPIIAHIDRYLAVPGNAKRMDRLADMPVLVQANAEFFLNRRTEKTALRMLRDGRIHLLGTDCHNLTSRKPNLEEALRKIEKRLGAEAIARINSWEQRVLQH